ncbi:hypothetical protein E2K93_15145 [Thalassotalea sp. HSM 43]|uniref:hypothetical protein n=1 Tax=Thalassotalea sp. HSM 43 TaxID=2552945 RepID=UPI0010819B8D|nr:hypothetical protein [Thalassotalea sp. HSM 43]QBY05620.1 hypothetical protein E2K93_15145 [Thalassotalea sp. HSM 43]
MERYRQAVAFTLKFILAIWCLSVSLAANSQTLKYNLKPLSQISEVGNKKGVAILYLKAQGTAPSMIIKPVSLTANQKFQRYKGRTDYKINLKGYEPGFYQLTLPKGSYQITEINAPFYDLPFSKDTNNDITWRFTVKAQMLSYIGELKIDGERSRNHVEINLFNRYASQYQPLKQLVAQLQIPYPLITGQAYHDDFARDFEGSE